MKTCTSNANLPDRFYVAICKSAYVIMAVILASINVPAQIAGTAVPFLTTSPSPTANAMGSAGITSFRSDPYNAYYNPGLTSITSTGISATVNLAPVKSENFFGFENESFAMQAGYDLERLINAPLRIGVGYYTLQNNNIQVVRTQVQPISPTAQEYINPVHNDAILPLLTEVEERSSAYTLSLGVDFGVKIGVGITHKTITSVFQPLIFTGAAIERPIGGRDNLEATAIDYGVAIHVPVIESLENLTGMTFAIADGLKPDLNFALGYAVVNIGSDVAYNSQTTVDPLPRTASLGYAFNTGLLYEYNDIKFRLIDLDWTLEIHDLLVRRNEFGFDYQAPLSDVKAIEHLLLGRASDKIERRVGWRIEFGELVLFSGGHYTRDFGDGIVAPDTRGVTLRAKGLFKTAALVVQHDIIRFLYRHVDVRYTSAQYETHVFNTEFDYTGAALVIENITF